MKTNKIFSLDVNLVQNLKDIDNASALVNSLLSDYFSSLKQDVEKRDPEMMLKEAEEMKSEAEAFMRIEEEDKEKELLRRQEAAKSEEKIKIEREEWLSKPIEERRRIVREKFGEFAKDKMSNAK